MRKVLVCSPYRGDIEKNTKRAVHTAKISCDFGHTIVQHFYFPQFLDENDQFERTLGIEYVIEIMKDRYLLWLLGQEIASGMEYELEVSKEIQQQETETKYQEFSVVHTQIKAANNVLYSTVEGNIVIIAQRQAKWITRIIFAVVTIFLVLLGFLPTYLNNIIGVNLWTVIAPFFGIFGFFGFKFSFPDLIKKINLLIEGKLIESHKRKLLTSGSKAAKFPRWSINPLGFKH